MVFLAPADLKDFELRNQGQFQVFGEVIYFLTSA
jgi:hypothetical protein